MVPSSDWTSVALSNREIWLRAGTILAEHGPWSAKCIVSQLAQARGDCVAVQEWRRVGAALDYIVDVEPPDPDLARA